MITICCSICERTEHTVVAGISTAISGLMMQLTTSAVGCIHPSGRATRICVTRMRFTGDYSLTTSRVWGVAQQNVYSSMLDC